MSDRSTDRRARSPLLRRLLGTGTVDRRSLETEEPEPQDAPAGAVMLERLDAIERRLADVARSTEARPAAAPPDDGQGEAALQQALASLEKQISRAGREQLKANTLLEAHVEHLDAALEALRTADVRREAEIAMLREQSRDAEVNARLEIVQAILPALDGLDEALRSGQQLLERPGAPPSQRRHFWWPRHRAPASSAAEAARREGMAAWLTGLTFVRQRLLDVLAAEAVVPVEARGQPFDPRRHVALEVVPASDEVPSGMVAAELRRGYLVGDRVLRHAEVAVAKEQGTEHRG